MIVILWKNFFGMTIAIMLNGTRASFIGGDYVGLEVYASRRLNDFYSNTDRVEVSIDGYRQQL